MARLRNIEGIDEILEAKLNKVGVNNVDDYLEATSTKKGRQNLAKETGIDEDQILTWANHVDLFRIKGVREQYGELLEAAGVDTVPELAQRNPDNLHAALKEINDEKQLVKRLPGRDQVADWIEQAKDLPRVLEY